MKYFVVIIIGFLGCTALVADDNITDRESYLVLPGDVLQVSVWKEPDLQLEVLVRPDGAFSFPLAGEISSDGHTVEELQAEVKSRLGRYISDPVVTVAVSQILGNKIYVIGQVERPGVFVVNPRVDVMQALSMAGGGTAYADLNNIIVLRRSGSAQKSVEFRYNEVIKGRNLDQNIILSPGDVVVVP